MCLLQIFPDNPGKDKEGSGHNKAMLCRIPVRAVRAGGGGWPQMAAQSVNW